MRYSCLLLATAAYALSGCTHLETKPDYSTAQFNEAVTGIPYALPALRYKLAVTSSIAACPTVLTLPLSKADRFVSDGAFSLATKVVPTASYVPGERYIADYGALTSPFKTSSFSIENYPSGVLKAVNVSAEDQSGPLIKNIVSIGLSIAGMAGVGVPSSLLVPMSMIPKTREDVDAEIEKLLKEAPSGAITCKPTTATDVTALAAAVDAMEKATGPLETATQAVTTWTTVNASRRANRDDLMALKAALESQAAAQQVFDGAKEVLDKAKAKVTLSAETWWPQNIVASPTAAGDVSQLAELSANDVQVLGDNLVLRAIPIVTKDRFASWWKRLSQGHRAVFMENYGTMAAHYGVTAVAGLDVPKPSEPIVCANETSLVKCLTTQLSFSGSLDLLDRPAGQGESPATTVGGPHPGILIRTAQKADFTLCPASKPNCGRKDQLAFEAGVSAPQFGQLRLLPFKNRMFEAAQLSLALREDGSLEKFEYKRTKAIAGEAAAAANDAIGQYEAFRDKQDKKGVDALAASRAEEIALVQHDIDLLTKRQALLKLQQPEQPSAQQAIVEETAMVNAEVALLNARLAKLKAEAALEGGASGE